MIIYEVNLKICKKIYHDFYKWLISHQEQMLTYNGFTKSEVFKVESGISDYNYLSVHYHISNIESLNNYFTNHAVKMQNEGIKLFKINFSAERRVLSKLD